MGTIKKEHLNSAVAIKKLTKLYGNWKPIKNSLIPVSVRLKGDIKKLRQAWRVTFQKENGKLVYAIYSFDGEIASFDQDAIRSCNQLGSRFVAENKVYIYKNSNGVPVYD